MTCLRLILTVLFSAVLVLSCSAGTILQTKGAATLEVHFEPEKPHLALADVITVTLKIEGEPTWKITAPRDLPPGASWVLIEPLQTKVKTVASGRILWQRVYHYAPREAGNLTFAFPDIAIFDEATKDQTIAWEPIQFQVTTTIAEPDRSKMRDITSIEELDLPPVPDSVWGWWLLLLIPLPLAIFVALRLFRRKLLRTPCDRALYECARLCAMKLPEQGRSERFVTLLTLLVRDYLERDCHFPARRQTTPEFVQSLARQSLLAREEQHFLAEFLQCAEMVKFAHVEMSVDECYAWERKVRQFLQKRGNTQSLPSEKKS